MNSMGVAFTQVIPFPYREVIQGEDRLDKKISPWECGSSRLWSLWDMLQINAKYYVQIGHFLRAVSDNLSARAKFDDKLNEADKASLDEKLPAFEINYLSEQIKTILSHCLSLELKISYGALYKINEDLANPLIEWTWRKAQSEFEYWNKRTFQTELETKLFFYIPDHRASFYKNNQLDEDVKKKIPVTIHDDMEEAGNCFATENYAACVFHLMRVMESGVQKLGDSLGVSLTNNKEWQSIINDIKHEINNKYPKKSHPEKYEKWTNLLAKLETVKDAWRNPTMHPRATYKESEAHDIIMSVRIFMNELAKWI